MYIRKSAATTQTGNRLENAGGMSRKGEYAIAYASNEAAGWAISKFSRHLPESRRQAHPTSSLIAQLKANYLVTVGGGDGLKLRSAY